MTVNQSFQNWTVISDEPGEQLVFEHDNTGERVTLDQDGSVAAPVTNVDTQHTKPVLVGECKADSHTYVGYEDLNTAVANAPTQAEIIVQGNITVSEPVAFTGTYLHLRGRGGYNRDTATGIASISAAADFSGGPLVDLSNIGSKWGLIQNLNLFCNSVATEGIYTGGSDNGAVRGTAIYEPTDYGIRTDGGAFDLVFDRCLIDGNGATTTGVYFTGGNEPKLYDSLIRECTSECLLIDNIGRVGPRLINTSFRAEGCDYGIRIANNGATRNITIDMCQFEGAESAAIAYAPTGNGGSVASFSISRSHFNANATVALDTNYKVGPYTLGPFNQFQVPVNLGGSGFSDANALTFNNVWIDTTLNDNRNQALAVLEPGLGRYEFPNGGPNGTGAVDFANTRIYEDANGEVVVEDSAGNTTTLS